MKRCHHVEFIFARRTQFVLENGAQCLQPVQIYLYNNNNIIVVIFILFTILDGRQIMKMHTKRETTQ